MIGSNNVEDDDDYSDKFDNTNEVINIVSPPIELQTIQPKSNEEKKNPNLIRYKNKGFITKTPT